jgi:hypothetical protein
MQSRRHAHARAYSASASPHPSTKTAFLLAIPFCNGSGIDSFRGNSEECSSYFSCVARRLKFDRQPCTMPIPIFAKISEPSVLQWDFCSAHSPKSQLFECRDIPEHHDTHGRSSILIAQPFKPSRNQRSADTCAPPLLHHSAAVEITAIPNAANRCATYYVPIGNSNEVLFNTYSRSVRTIDAEIQAPDSGTIHGASPSNFNPWPRQKEGHPRKLI